VRDGHAGVSIFLSAFALPHGPYGAGGVDTDTESRLLGV
jgi:hypothetical protein